MKKLKRNLSIILILALILSVFPCTKKASATSPKLSSKKITMKVGETRTIKLLNSKKKAFWSIENEKIMMDGIGVLPFLIVILQLYSFFPTFA